MEEETKGYLVGIFIVVLVLLMSYSMVYFMVLKPTRFCESKGYDWFHTNTEKGYIACCRTILKEHIKTDKNICEAFEKDKG